MFFGCDCMQIQREFDVKTHCVMISQRHSFRFTIFQIDYGIGMCNKKIIELTGFFLRYTGVWNKKWSAGTAMNRIYEWIESKIRIRLNEHVWCAMNVYYKLLFVLRWLVHRGKFIAGQRTRDRVSDGFNTEWGHLWEIQLSWIMQIRTLNSAWATWTALRNFTFLNKIREYCDFCVCILVCFRL